MRDEAFRKALDEYCCEMEYATKVFNHPSFDKSIIGVTITGRLIYEYSSMVKELVEDTGMSEDDAIEDIEYNTIGSLNPNSDDDPIILDATKDQILKMYG